MSLRQAAQQALEALEVADSWGTWYRGSKAITDLRAALAEPTSQESRQVEPVGYFSINSYGNWEQNESGYGSPLYAAPSKRAPLNTDLILARWAQECVPNRSTPELVVAFTRAIERAHGIGGEE